jgi:hypothetical protein
MFNRCIIIGSGNSLQEGLDRGIQDLFKNEITFTLNEEFRFFNSTATFFLDWTFYKCRYELLKNHPLIIGRFNPDIRHDNPQCPPPLQQLFMFPTCSKYVGRDSWFKGFYSGKLCGLFTLTSAIALGFTEIFILGYDGLAVNNKTHHYEGLNGYGQFVDRRGQPRTGVGVKNGKYNTGVFNQSRDDLWKDYSSELNQIKIYNVSLNSKISTFPKISYDDFISMINNNPLNIDQDTVRHQIKEHIKNHAKFDKNSFCFGS